MAQIVSRMGGNGTTLLLLSRKNPDVRNYISEDNFRVETDVDINTQIPNRLTIFDGEKIIINITSDEEAQLLFQTSLQDLIDEINQGLQ